MFTMRLITIWAYTTSILIWGAFFLSRTRWLRHKPTVQVFFARKSLAIVVLMLPLLVYIITTPNEMLRYLLTGQPETPPIAIPGTIYQPGERQQLPSAKFQWRNPDYMLTYSNFFRAGLWVGLYDWHEDKLYTFPIPTIELDGADFAQSSRKNLIAYATDYGRIQLVELDEQFNPTSITPVAAFGYNPSFSPDGQQLAFWRKTSDYPASLVILDLETLEERVVFEVQSEEARLRNTIWSPDGSSIAYIIRGNNPADTWEAWLVVLDLDTLQETVIDVGSLSEMPSWSPDGRLLSYVKRNWEGVDTLNIADVEHNCLAGVLEQDMYAAAWSPDGEVIAISVNHFLFFVDVEAVFGAPYSELSCAAAGD